MQAHALDLVPKMHRRQALATALSADGVACCYGTTGTGKMAIAEAVAEDRCYATSIRDDVIAFESDREDDVVLRWLEFEQHLLDNGPLIALSRGDGNRCHVYFLPGSKREADYLEKKAVEFDVVPKSRMIRPPGTLHKDGTTRSVVVGDVPKWLWELGPAPEPVETPRATTEPEATTTVDTAWCSLAQGYSQEARRRLLTASRVRRF